MVAYEDFVSLSESTDSEERGQAAHLAAKAFLAHTGPADEHAALYAALIGFLDDPSVRVRAALAYGLLHAPEAPRPILIALLHDSAVISRAVAQYSPGLIDADLIGFAKSAAPDLLDSIAMRDRLTPRVVEALLARGEQQITLRLLQRADVTIAPATLASLSRDIGVKDAAFRGALLDRVDLPASARLVLVEAVAQQLRGARIVAGAIAAPRLDRLFSHAMDTAVTEIGEEEAVSGGAPYAAELVAEDKLSTRVLLHALVNGHVLFFADCLAVLSENSREKVFTLLETGSRPALNALLARCGISEAVRNLIARLIFHARAADLADDITARHFIVTALTEELIAEHSGNIPPNLEEAFYYLSEQNVLLARQAARGVISAFVEGSETHREMPLLREEPRFALTA